MKLTAPKLPFRSGRWFLDQREAMEWQPNAPSNPGWHSRFAAHGHGSRSSAPYPRREYFRRTLCNLAGREIESGGIPDCDELIGPMICSICH